MRDIIFECTTPVLPQCNRRYKFELFGVDEALKGNVSTAKRVVLPETVMSLKTIEWGMHAHPFGMPNKVPNATVIVNISELNPANNDDHKVFVEMCMNQGKWSLRPTLYITELRGIDLESDEIPTGNGDGRHFFVGKIESSGTTGINLDDVETEILVTHLFYYVLTNMSVPAFAEWKSDMPNYTADKAGLMMDIFSYAVETGGFDKIQRPFAFYADNNWDEKRATVLYFPRPSNARRKRNNMREEPLADGSRTVKFRDWNDLYGSYIEFIKLYDLLFKLESLVIEECNKHTRGLTRPPNVNFRDIYQNSPLKWYKQTYNNTGAKGAELNFEDMYIFSKINHKSTNESLDDWEKKLKPTTVFDLNHLARRGRWNNMWEFIWCLATSNLVRFQYDTSKLNFENPKVLEDRQKSHKIVVSRENPIEVDEIIANYINPLDNVDIVYLESNMTDDIRNHRDVVGGVSNNKNNRDLTMQLVWHNQPPNNARGFNSSGFMTNAYVTAWVDGRDRVFQSWGKNVGGDSIERTDFFYDLGDAKSGYQFNYLIWYFENLKPIFNNRLNMTFPYLVHNGIAELESGSHDLHEVVNQIQTRGCIHNQIVSIIDADWRKKGITHYGVALKIPLIMLEDCIEKILGRHLVATNSFDGFDYQIDTVARFGIDLSKEKGWFIMGSKVDYQEGIAEVELINRK